MLNYWSSKDEWTDVFSYLQISSEKDDDGNMNIKKEVVQTYVS